MRHSMRSSWWDRLLIWSKSGGTRGGLLQLLPPNWH